MKGTFHRYSTGKKIKVILAHAFLAVLAVVWLLPVLWVILTSFRGTKGSYSSTFFPTRYTLDNYIKLFTDFSVFNFPKMVWNTFIIASVSCIISTFFVISVAYTLSRLRFRARKPLMNAAMIIHLFPGFMSMIAVYYIIKMLGWSDGPMLRVAMIAVYAGGAGCGYHIAKGFFDTISMSLDEAALLDVHLGRKIGHNRQFSLQTFSDGNGHKGGHSACCAGLTTFLMFFSIFARGSITSRPQPVQRILKSMPTRSTSKLEAPQGCFLRVRMVSPTAISIALVAPFCRPSEWSAATVRHPDHRPCRTYRYSIMQTPAKCKYLPRRMHIVENGSVLCPAQRRTQKSTEKEE